MDALYPNLHDRFKIEGICPICLTEMELAPRYSCANGHTFCYHCKPFFYDCPTCGCSVNVVTPPARGSSSQPPPPTHFLPYPVVPPLGHPPYPTAPPIDDGNQTFLNHERRHLGPPQPPTNDQLLPCAYAHLGCWVKVPTYLRKLHESRCQFRPHMEEEMLPTDLAPNQNDLVECKHHVVGCKVRMPAWRKSIHEGVCNYKEKYLAMNSVIESIGCVTIVDDDDRHRLHGDPEELVNCKYRRYGCMVRMPRRRKYVHEEKCNYREYYQPGDDEEIVHHPPDPESNPDEQMDCRWAEYGCRVRPKLYRKSAHEEKCNYRMEECSYKDYGCGAMFEPARRYAHEKSCSYAP